MPRRVPQGPPGAGGQSPSQHFCSKPTRLAGERQLDIQLHHFRHALSPLVVLVAYLSPAGARGQSSSEHSCAEQAGLDRRAAAGHPAAPLQACILSAHLALALDTSRCSCRLGPSGLAWSAFEKAGTALSVHILPWPWMLSGSASGWVPQAWRNQALKYQAQHADMQHVAAFWPPAGAVAQPVLLLSHLECMRLVTTCEDMQHAHIVTCFMASRTGSSR